MKTPKKQELIKKIQELEEQVKSKDFESSSNSLDQIIDTIRKVIRAKNGLPTDDDIFNGLLNIKEIRQLTRLEEHNVYGHSYARLLFQEGKDEWEIMNKIPDMEDNYFISEDGEQRKEAILMTRARTVSDAQNLSINLPATSPQEIKNQAEANSGQIVPKKKSWVPWKR